MPPGTTPADITPMNAMMVSASTFSPMRSGTRCSTCLVFQSWVARRMLQTISRPT
jgi:hypothetical protein